MMKCKQNMVMKDKTTNQDSEIQVMENQKKKVERSPVPYQDDDIVIIRDLFRIKPKMPVKEDMLIVACCIRGKMNLTVNGNDYHLEHDMLIVMQPMDIIDNCTLSFNQDCRVVCLSKSFVNSFLDNGNLIRLGIILRKNPVVRLEHCKVVAFVNLLETVDESMKNDTLYYKKILTCQIEACLYDIIGGIDQECIRERKEIYCANTRPEQIFNNFIALLRSTKVKMHPIGYYSDQLCLTPKYLSMIVKHVSGKSCAKLIQDFVVDDIKYNLRTTDKQIKEIADELGFANQSFCAQFFRRHVGCSPSKYRTYIKNRTDEVTESEFKTLNSI